MGMSSCPFFLSVFHFLLDEVRSSVSKRHTDRTVFFLELSRAQLMPFSDRNLCRVHTRSMLLPYSPLDGMLVYRRVTSSIKFAGTHLYTWVERGTLLPKYTTQCPRPGLEPGPLDPETSALTMKPPRLLPMLLLLQKYCVLQELASDPLEYLQGCFVIIITFKNSANSVDIVHSSACNESFFSTLCSKV